MAHEYVSAHMAFQCGGFLCVPAEQVRRSHAHTHSYPAVAHRLRKAKSSAKYKVSVHGKYAHVSMTGSVCAQVFQSMLCSPESDGCLKLLLKWHGRYDPTKLASALGEVSEWTHSKPRYTGCVVAARLLYASCPHGMECTLLYALVSTTRVASW